MPRSIAVVPPESKGMCAKRLIRVRYLLNQRIQRNMIRAVSLVVMRDDAFVDRWASGRRAEPEGSELVDPDTRFLVASLTKPVTAAATLRLVEEGALSLSTSVVSILPAFAGDGRDAIQLWHLLTHTSGLPDMVPNNQELRNHQADLQDFFESVCRVEPMFEPGTQACYQSMGFLVMATMVERITGIAFREFVDKEIFRPAVMPDSHLGISDVNHEERDAQVDLPLGQRNTNWHWNTRYWRCLGAPWGGLITTATDLVSFLYIFLNGGRSFDGCRVLSPGTLRIMTRDWLSRRGPAFSPWGLGWMIRGRIVPRLQSFKPEERHLDPAGVVTSREFTYDRDFLGDLVSQRTFGHPGATGCMMWVDPKSRLAAVVLTTTPGILHGATFCQISNLIASALV